MGSGGVAPSTLYFEIVSIPAGLSPYRLSYIISCELTVLPEVADRREVRTIEALHESFTGRMQCLSVLRARTTAITQTSCSRGLSTTQPPPCGSPVRLSSPQECNRFHWLRRWQACSARRPPTSYSDKWEGKEVELTERYSRQSRKK